MENKVVGIRFKSAGKKYYFDPINLDLSPGDFVVVETVRGIELGEVIEGIKTIDEKELIATLKPVLRKATQQDILQEEENNKENSHIVSVCKALVKKNTLDMKVLSSEYTLDKSKLIIYFTAEGRIDFRELVKDLANEFKVRIELRQVGARDGAKFLGGIGPCGYLLCCNTFLGEFETVSIKMAKNQNLSLNPTNISGLCGKLLCCIRYEDDTYYEFRQKMPKIMSKVKTKEGIGRVIASNIIDLSVKVELQDSMIRNYDVEDLLEIFEYDLEPNGKDHEAYTE
ncbi:MAG: stage 0 sporulation family protein [Candidatus Izemoplasmataceae bacterium]